MRAQKVASKIENIVLVADVLDEIDTGEPTDTRRNLEMTDKHTLDSLISEILTLGFSITHYQSPNSLAQNAENHINDLVLAIYGGERSRNRMALIPAICESFGISFIGPDVYGRIIAQDKEISKRLAVDCNLRTPAWRLIRTAQEINRPIKLNYPVVIKPLLEGSSIGISQRNVANSQLEAKKILSDLLSKFDQPLLSEEFVAGREVAYCKIQHPTEDLWAFSEVVMKEDPHYFKTHLFDAHEKLFRSVGRTVINIDQELHPKDKECLDAFLQVFGTYGYCRVDGRFVNGRFHFIEFSPDAWIAPSGQFAMSFTEKGWSYNQVIKSVLSSTTPNLLNQSTSG